LHKRFIRIVGEQPLIEILRWSQRWTVAEQHVEEFKPVHMPPQNHQAQRQWRR